MALSLRNPSLVHAPEAHWFAPLPFLGKSTLVASSLRDILRGQTRRLHPPASPVFFLSCFDLHLFSIAAPCTRCRRFSVTAALRAQSRCAVLRSSTPGSFLFRCALESTCVSRPVFVSFSSTSSLPSAVPVRRPLPCRAHAYQVSRTKKSAKKKQRFCPAPRGPPCVAPPARLHFAFYAHARDKIHCLLAVTAGSSVSRSHCERRETSSD